MEVVTEIMTNYNYSYYVSTFSWKVLFELKMWNILLHCIRVYH